MNAAFYVILAAFMGWFVTQIIAKLILGLSSAKNRAEFKNLRSAVRFIFRSGGMPSSHTGTMVAVTMFLGLSSGFASQLFGLAVAVTIIIMYDATHVRYAVGEQGKALNQLLDKSGKKELPIVAGHTLTEVVVGAMLGALAGWLAWLVAGL